MRQLLIFCLLFVTSIWIDLHPIDIDSLYTKSIFVSLTGAVEKDTTIDLEPYSTIQDALSMVTLAPDADPSLLNPNTVLKDGDVLNIPTQIPEGDSLIVSINNASVEQLDLLPGIGASTAQKIVDYRNQHGLFQSLEDLMNVSGIGETKFQNIEEYLTL